MFLDAQTIGHGKGLDPGKDGRSGVAFFNGTVPIFIIAGKVKAGLFPLHLRFLDRDDIGVQFFHGLLKALIHAGPKAVDIPGDKFHEIPPFTHKEGKIQ